MPKLTGLQATREIKAQAPDVAVLILSMHDDERYLFEALKAGAAGYVLKHEADHVPRRRGARRRPPASRSSPTRHSARSCASGWTTTARARASR